MEQAGEAKSRHSTWRDYLQAFVGLAVLTVLEIGVTLLPIPRLPFLLALMGGKVLLVAMFYMHLRTDSRWYAYLFLVPVPFVVLVAAALLVYAF